MQKLDITPNYKAIFERMLGEARHFGNGSKLFASWSYAREAEALRAIQRFLAPLNVALNAMSSQEDLEALKAALGEIVVSIDQAAREAEVTLESSEVEP